MRIIFIFLFILSISPNCIGQIEIVKENDFKINGNLKLFTTKENLLKIIVTPDTIENNIDVCEGYIQAGTSSNERLYYYLKSGVKFLVYKNVADFIDVDLKNNRSTFILYKKFKLSAQTTLNDLKKYFPIAVNNFLKTKGMVIRLKFNSKFDDELQIKIEKGKVSSFIYWTPC